MFFKINDFISLKDTIKRVQRKTRKKGKNIFVTYITHNKKITRLSKNTYKSMKKIRQPS